MSEFEYLMDYARQNGEIAALKNAADTIEKLQGELNKIVAVIPTREDTTIADDVLAYVQWTQELVSQYVAIREAIREKCEVCVSRQEKTIERCPFGNCPLWPFRRLYRYSHIAGYTEAKKDKMTWGEGCCPPSIKGGINMTREEILAMKPGRELDALIYGIMHGSTIPRKGDNRYDTMPRYSTDIAAAWTIMERFFPSPLVWREHERNPIGWHVRLRDLNYDLWDEVVCDSFPEAMCKAALLAGIDCRRR